MSDVTSRLLTLKAQIAGFRRSIAEEKKSIQANDRSQQQKEHNQTTKNSSSLLQTQENNYNVSYGSPMKKSLYQPHKTTPVKRNALYQQQPQIDQPKNSHEKIKPNKKQTKQQKTRMPSIKLTSSSDSDTEDEELIDIVAQAKKLLQATTRAVESYNTRYATFNQTPGKPRLVSTFSTQYSSQQNTKKFAQTPPSYHIYNRFSTLSQPQKQNAQKSENLSQKPSHKNQKPIEQQYLKQKNQKTSKYIPEYRHIDPSMFSDSSIVPITLSESDFDSLSLSSRQSETESDSSYFQPKQTRTQQKTKPPVIQDDDSYSYASSVFQSEQTTSQEYSDDSFYRQKAKQAFFEDSDTYSYSSLNASETKPKLTQQRKEAQKWPKPTRQKPKTQNKHPNDDIEISSYKSEDSRSESVIISDYYSYDPQYSDNSYNSYASEYSENISRADDIRQRVQKILESSSSFVENDKNTTKERSIPKKRVNQKYESDDYYNTYDYSSAYSLTDQENYQQKYSPKSNHLKKIENERTQQTKKIEKQTQTKKIKQNPAQIEEKNNEIKEQKKRINKKDVKFENPPQKPAQKSKKNSEKTREIQNEPTKEIRNQKQRKSEEFEQKPQKQKELEQNTENHEKEQKEEKRIQKQQKQKETNEEKQEKEPKEEKSEQNLSQNENSDQMKLQNKFIQEDNHPIYLSRNNDTRESFADCTFESSEEVVEAAEEHSTEAYSSDPDMDLIREQQKNMDKELKRRKSNAFDNDSMSSDPHPEQFDSIEEPVASSNWKHQNSFHSPPAFDDDDEYNETAGYNTTGTDTEFNQQQENKNIEESSCTMEEEQHETEKSNEQEIIKDPTDIEESANQKYESTLQMAQNLLKDLDTDTNTENESVGPVLQLSDSDMENIENDDQILSIDDD